MRNDPREVFPTSAAHLEDVPVTKAGFSVRATNCLLRVNVLTLGQLSGWTELDLDKVSGVGATTREEVLGRIARLASDSMSPTSAPGRRDTNDDLAVVAAMRAVRAWREEPILAGQAVAAMVDTVFAQVLDRRVDTILTSRYQLEGGARRTLQDLGDEFGISRERVRQLSAKGVTRVRGRLRRAYGWSVIVETIEDLAPSSALEWSDLAEQVWPGSHLAGGHLLLSLTTNSTHRSQTWSKLVADAREELDRQKRTARDSSKRAQRRNRHAARLAQLLADSMWPATSRHGEPTLPSPARQTNEASTVAWYSHKLGRDVACESRSERDFFELCDASEEVVSYAEQPFALAYQLSGGSRRYYPDALLHLSDGRLLLVEIKPPFEASLSINRAKWQAAWEWCDRYGVGLLITSHRETLPGFLARHEIDDRLRERMRQRLQQGPLYFPELLAMKEEGGFGSADLTGMVLTEGWELSTRPWVLRMPVKN